MSESKSRIRIIKLDLPNHESIIESLILIGRKQIRIIKRIIIFRKKKNEIYKVIDDL